VELHAGIYWVQLQVEGGCFDLLLGLTVELGETRCEGIGDAEFHRAPQTISCEI